MFSYCWWLASANPASIRCRRKIISLAKRSRKVRQNHQDFVIASFCPKRLSQERVGLMAIRWLKQMQSLHITTNYWWNKNNPPPVEMYAAPTKRWDSPSQTAFLFGCLSIKTSIQMCFNMCYLQTSKGMGVRTTHSQTTKASSWRRWNSLAGEVFRLKIKKLEVFYSLPWLVLGGSLHRIDWHSLACSFYSVPTSLETARQLKQNQHSFNFYVVG